MVEAWQDCELRQITPERDSLKGNHVGLYGRSRYRAGESSLP